MRAEWQRGYLPIDFPAERFDSARKLLWTSARVYFSNFRFLALLTLAVFLPAKLALQLASDWLEVPKGGLAAYLTMDLSDLVLGALVAPAAIYGLLERLRTGQPASLGQSLQWGRRQWVRMLWNKVKMEITITLWGALFVIPGLVATVRLIFVEAIVAVEADRQAAPLERSRELSRGYGWRIFAVLAPVMIVDLAGTFLALDAAGGSQASRPVIALVDSLLSVGGQWSTVIGLLIYLGVAPAEPSPARPPARKPRRKIS